jgi:sulfur-oxidizing protein SoxY
MKMIRAASGRRRFLAALGACLAVPCGALAPRRAARAQGAAREALLQQVTGGAPVRVGRVTLDTPPLADNGHSVQVRVRVDSPMTQAEHVRSITLVAERNPRPIVAKFSLTPGAGRAEIVTRIRLADNQEVLALAELSDGTFWSGSASVVVTELACLEG